MLIFPFNPLIFITLIFLALAGCNSDDSDETPSASVTTSAATKDITVKFTAAVNDQPFVCGNTYQRVGRAVTDTYKITDFRFYLHNVTLIEESGQKVSLNLTQDGKWQYQNVAMLDFENACLNGTQEMNTQVVGIVSNNNAYYRGICFTLGIPFNLNHINDATATSPLNMSGMLWSWTTGRKFVRIDGVGDPEGLKQSYMVHLGSTGCVDSDKSGGEPDGPCTYPNTPEICFDNFDTTKHTIVADAGYLLREANVAYNTPQTAAGCMSGNSDLECVDVMPKFGIDFVYNDGVNPPITYSKQQEFFHFITP
jgi:uncharacterized repeat protein (TIGR04052 family)